MPKQPTGQPTQGPGPQKTGPAWSAVLQIIVAVAVGTALVAGPQIWAFGERLNGDWKRWSSDQWPRSATPPPRAPATSTRPAVIPAAPVSDPAVRAAASQPPARSVARATASKPSTPSKPSRVSNVKSRPQVARTTLSAPVLLEPRLDPKAYHEMYMKQGIDLYQAGWFGPAIGRFRRAAAIIPSPTAYLWIGRAAIRAGRSFEARTALERAIALAPDSAAAREANALLDRLKTEKSPS